MVRWIISTHGDWWNMYTILVNCSMKKSVTRRPSDQWHQCQCQIQRCYQISVLSGWGHLAFSPTHLLCGRRIHSTCCAFLHKLPASVCGCSGMSVVRMKKLCHIGPGLLRCVCSAFWCDDMTGGTSCPTVWNRSSWYQSQHSVSETCW